MAINYDAAGKWAMQVRALAMGESNESPYMFGDGGCAFGLLQQHPSFFIEYYDTDAFPASVTDTWWQAQIKAAAAFLETWESKLGLDLAVQSYNQGVVAVTKNGVRAPEYLARFTANFNKLKGQKET
jgi:hypothetical protein